MMKHIRLMACVLVLVQSASVWPQEYPSRTIRIVNPFAAGTGNDNLARALAQRLMTVWGQPAVVENRVGAGGIIGAEFVAKSAPDGYTLLSTTASLAVNASLIPRLPFDVRRDFAPISQLSSGPMVLVVHPSVPARTLKEFVEMAKTRKEGLNFGSSGAGTTAHLASAWLQQLSGLKVTPVHYKGQTPAFTALAGGEVEFSLPGVGAQSIGLIAARKLRAIAVTTRQKSRVLPDLPTVASIYPEFDVDNWLGLWAPAGTPQPLTQKIHSELVAALGSQEFATRFPDSQLMGTSPTAFASHFDREIEKYAKLIKQIGMRPET